MELTGGTQTWKYKLGSSAWNACLEHNWANHSWKGWHVDLSYRLRHQPDATKAETQCIGRCEALDVKRDGCIKKATSERWTTNSESDARKLPGKQIRKATYDNKWGSCKSKSKRQLGRQLEEPRSRKANERNNIVKHGRTFRKANKEHKCNV